MFDPTHFYLEMTLTTWRTEVSDTTQMAKCFDRENVVINNFNASRMCKYTISHKYSCICLTLQISEESALLDTVLADPND
jgi:hypothetical protein